jgi:hypothetical protein
MSIDIRQPTLILLNNPDVERDRLQVIFEDRKELVFRVECEMYRDLVLVLDTALTEPALVDKLLLPQNGAWDPDVDRNIYSKFSEEDCKRLRIAFLPSMMYFTAPKSGNGMYIWKTTLLSKSSACCYAVMEDSGPIAAFASFVLDS